MKIMFYNIAYGTGLNGSWKQYLSWIWRFFWLPLRVMKKLVEVLKKEAPDILCLAEVDGGSFRNRFRSQASHLAHKLMFPFVFSQSKYHNLSPWQLMTAIRKQEDAILSRKDGQFTRHELRSGMKKLVQEFVVDGVSIYTVHLAVLSKNVRRRQLRELAEILKKCPRPHLLCGDFNIHKGLKEIKEFMQSTGLRRVINQPTFPSFSPSRYLDIFFASPDVTIKNAGVVQAIFSDHLPVWVEI